MDTLQNDDTTPKKDVQYFVTTYKIQFIAVLVAIAIIFGFCLLVQSSLPGEVLYTVKTNIFENAMESSKLSVKSKTQYQITKMEHRLSEVKNLSKKDSIREGAIADFIQQTTKHSDTLNILIAKSIDSAFSKTDVLNTINEFAGIAGAIETVSENNSKLISIGDSVEENRQNTVRLYKDKVESFVQTETQQMVLEYLKVQLAEVKHGLGDENLSRKTVNIVENYLERVTEALTTKNLNKAISAAGEAHRLIKIEQYSGIVAAYPAPELDTTTASTTQTTSTTSLPQNTSTTTTSTVE